MEQNLRVLRLGLTEGQSAARRAVLWAVLAAVFFISYFLNNIKIIPTLILN